MKGRLIISFLLVSAAISIGCATATAQDDRRRELVVSVFAPDIKDPLTAENMRFDVRIGKQTARVLSTRPLNRSPRIVFLYDNSGSMGETKRRKNTVALEILQQMVAATAGQGELALFSFDDKVRMQCPLTDDKSKIDSAMSRISALRPAGMSPLIDGLYVAATALHPVQRGDAVVVITDGGNNASKLMGEKVAQYYLQGELRLFVVMLRAGDSDHDSIDEALESDSVWKLSHVTGGRPMIYPTAISSHFAKRDLLAIQAAIRSPFVLSVELPPQWDAKSRLQVRLLDDKGKPRKGTEAFSPQVLPSKQAAATTN